MTLTYEVGNHYLFSNGEVRKCIGVDDHRGLFDVDGTTRTFDTSGFQYADTHPLQIAMVSRVLFCIEDPNTIRFEVDSTDYPDYNLPKFFTVFTQFYFGEKLLCLGLLKGSSGWLIAEVNEGHDFCRVGKWILDGMVKPEGDLSNDYEVIKRLLYMVLIYAPEHPTKSLKL